MFDTLGDGDLCVFTSVSHGGADSMTSIRGTSYVSADASADASTRHHTIGSLAFPSF